MPPASKTGPGTKPTLSRRKRVLLAIVLGLGCVGFLEAGASLIYFVLVPSSARTAVETAVGLAEVGATRAMRFRPHAYLGYTANPGYTLPDGTAPFQEPGIRAQRVPLRDKPANRIRIVAIGGSTTFGLADPDGSHAWPALVESGLRERLADPAAVDVVNAGVPSYTTFELLAVASMWLPEWKPDIVLVHCGLNDAFTVGFPDEGGPDNAAFRHAWTEADAPGFAKAVMRRSYFARLLGMRLFTPSGFGLGDLSAATQFPQPPETEVQANVSRATGKYFRRNLDEIVTLVERGGATPVLVTEPLNPDKEVGQGPYYDAVSRAVLRNNGIMDEVGRERGVLVIDAFARMRDPAHFTDACHETEAGMKVKAAAVVEGIEPIVARMIATSDSTPRARDP